MSMRAGVVVKGKGELNMAQGQIPFKTATQGSTHGDGTPLRAVDGHTTGIYASGSCTHTNSNNNQNWWQGTFEGIYKVAKVKIWNRNDCCYDRSVPFPDMSVDSSICG